VGSIYGDTCVERGRGLWALCPH